jgi:hypothetical protein
VCSFIGHYGATVSDMFVRKYGMILTV